MLLEPHITVHSLPHLRSLHVQCLNLLSRVSRTAAISALQSTRQLHQLIESQLRYHHYEAGQYFSACETLRAPASITVPPAFEYAARATLAAQIGANAGPHEATFGARLSGPRHGGTCLVRTNPNFSTQGQHLNFTAAVTFPDFQGQGSVSAAQTCADATDHTLAGVTPNAVVLSVPRADESGANITLTLRLKPQATAPDANLIAAELTRAWQGALNAQVLVQAHPGKPHAQCA